MLIVETVDKPSLLSARVTARCVASCLVRVGLFGFNAVGANDWRITPYRVSAGDRVRLKVRRPYPAVGAIVDTATILELTALPPR